MADIFSVFGQYLGYLKIFKYIGYTFLFLIIGAIIAFLIVFLLVQFKSKTIIELNLVTRKIKFYRGRLKKNRKGIKMLWVGRLKKFIPSIQEEDIYLKGFKDVIILIKDNNSLHHTARLPTYEEIIEWYNKVHNIDIEEIKNLKEQMGTIYLLPNPSENIDWLADKCEEAKKEFIEAWWKSPVIMMIGTVFICAMVFILTLIITKKM